MPQDREVDTENIFDDDDEIDQSFFDRDTRGILSDQSTLDQDADETLDEPEPKNASGKPGEVLPAFSHESEDGNMQRVGESNQEGNNRENEECDQEVETEVDPESTTAVATKPDGDTILDQLLDAANYKRVREACDFGRSYAEMNYSEDFAYLVGRVHEIVKKYKDRGFAANISSAADDLIELSGLLVTLSEPLGYLEGCFEEAEEIRKLAKSALYLEAKKLKVEGWRVTDRDAEHIGRQLAHPYILQKGKADIHARMMRNLWYGTRHFIDMLNATIMRAGSEMKYVEMSEAAAHRAARKDPKDFPPDDTGFQKDLDEIQKEIDGKKKPKDDDGWDDGRGTEIQI